MPCIVMGDWSCGLPGGVGMLVLKSTVESACFTLLTDCFLPTLFFLGAGLTFFAMIVTSSFELSTLFFALLRRSVALTTVGGSVTPSAVELGSIITTNSHSVT